MLAASTASAIVVCSVSIGGLAPLRKYVVAHSITYNCSVKLTLFGCFATDVPSLTTDGIAVAVSDLSSVPPAASNLAVAASDLSLIPLAASGLADAASDMVSLVLSINKRGIFQLDFRTASPRSHTLPCGSLRGGVPPSSYFTALSRCAIATVLNGSEILSMVASTVASDSSLSSKCRLGQSLPFEHDTTLPSGLCCRCFLGTPRWCELQSRLNVCPKVETLSDHVVS